MDLDLIVIGSGPSGQRAAVQAAKLGKRVAVVERRLRLGGNSIHTGTIPSKTLREAVLDELASRPLDMPDPVHPEQHERTAVQHLMDMTARVVGAETSVVREQLRRNDVGLLFGEGSFVDEHTIRVRDDTAVRDYTAEHVIIAVGTRPARPADVAFDDATIVDSDGILKLKHRVPRTMTVVGAGVIGVEYASMFGALGTKVTIVDQRTRVLDFLDGEIGESLQYLLRRQNVTFRLNEKVAGVERGEGAATTRLASGKVIRSESVLYATGRQGSTEELALENVGLEPDKRGRIPVDDEYRTTVPTIYAVGDVCGPPGLAAAAHGAGPHRVAARLRPARPPAPGARPHRRLLDPGDRDGRPHGGAADRGRGALRRGRLTLGRAGPRRHDRRRERDAQAARLDGGPPDPRRPRDRHRRHRARPHRPSRDGRRQHRRLPRRGGLQLPDVRRVATRSPRSTPSTGWAEAAPHQPSVPAGPLNGPTRSDVIHPP